MQLFEVGGETRFPESAMLAKIFLAQIFYLLAACDKKFSSDRNLVSDFFPSILSEKKLTFFKNRVKFDKSQRDFTFCLVGRNLRT